MQVRTSTGTFFGLGEHPVLRDIESRISAVTHLPAINGEGIQVLLSSLELLRCTCCCKRVLLHFSTNMRWDIRVYLSLLRYTESAMSESLHKCMGPTALICALCIFTTALHVSDCGSGSAFQ